MGFSIMADTFEKCDFIGPQIGMERKGSTRFRSIEGGVLSVISVAIIAFITFMFGQEIYQRKRPNISISQTIREYSDFSVTGIPIWFDLYTFDGQFLTPNISDYISMSVALIKVDENTNVSEDTTSFRMDICYNFSQFIDYEKFIPYTTTYSWCVKGPSNFSFSNEPIATNSSTLAISVYKCDVSQRKCADDLEEIFDSLYFIMGNLNSMVTSSNYDKPVAYYLENNFFPMSNQLHKNIQINFIKDIYNSDNGWIFEDIFETVYLSRNDIQYQYNVITSDSNVERLVLQFSSPRLIYITNRNYMKVQELFAKIGGVATSIIIISNLISFHYLRFKYLLYVRDNSIYDFLETNKNFNGNYKDLIEANNNKLSTIGNISKLDQNQIRSPRNIINELEDLSKAKISNQNNQNRIDIQTDDIIDNINSTSLKKPQLLSINNIHKFNINSKPADVKEDQLESIFNSKYNDILKIKLSANKETSNNNKAIKSILNLLVIEPENTNYINYLSSYFYCKRGLKENYKTLLSNVEDLISLEKFSRMMANYIYS